MQLIHDKNLPHLGRLYDDNYCFICYTLDPRILSFGCYNVEMTYSPRFKRNLPLIYNVDFPASRGFRIHAGNTLKDSQGCILVGDGFSVQSNGKITLTNSKKTLEKLLLVIIQQTKMVII